MEFFYLWEENKAIFDIFQVARYYLTEWGKLAPAIIVPLIQEKGLPLAASLIDLQHILAGYSDETQVQNGKSE